MTDHDHKPQEFGDFALVVITEGLTSYGGKVYPAWSRGMVMEGWVREEEAEDPAAPIQMYEIHMESDPDEWDDIVSAKPSQLERYCTLCHGTQEEQKEWANDFLDRHPGLMENVAKMEARMDAGLPTSIKVPTGLSPEEWRELVTNGNPDGLGWNLGDLTREEWSNWLDGSHFDPVDPENSDDR